jgi:hypothetical protein
VKGQASTEKPLPNKEAENWQTVLDPYQHFASRTRTKHRGIHTPSDTFSILRSMSSTHSHSDHGHAR